MKSVSQITQRSQLIIILLTYLFFASILGFTYRYVVNPDGLSLLRLAGYIAEGNFLQSVTHSWSPLITWLFSPFLFLGFDGLIAARITISLCGVGLIYCSWLLSLRFDLSQELRFIAALIAAVLVSAWSVKYIAADVLITTLVIYYLYLVTDSHIITRTKSAFYCGLVGGISYLAHHYAFPFFLAHFPLMLFLKGYFERDKEGYPMKRVLISWGAGMIGFLIIASIWVGVVSVKYGELKISSKGPIARAAVGPKHKGHPFFAGGLFKPRDSYAMHVFEDPSEVQFKTWSPFESKEYFMHQLSLIKDNAGYILNHFVTLSPFFTYAFIIGILALIPLALLLNPLNDKKRYLYAWVVLTFSIYSSGFLLLIARSPRRFYALMIVFLFLAFHFLEEIQNALQDIVSDRRRKVLTFYLVLIAVLAFALKPGVNFLKTGKDTFSREQVNPYREIAEQIVNVKFPSPYAMIRSSQKPHTDIYIAYYLKKQLLGRPFARDVEGITKELKAVDAKSLVVFDNLELVGNLKKDKRYVQIASKKLKENEKYENAKGIIISDHEIITGWDKEVNIFILEQ